MSLLAGCLPNNSTGGGNSSGAPSGVVYSENPAHYTQTVEITPNRLVFNGQAATAVSISPATLPDGLVFDATNGTITGTPTAVTAPQTYSVRVQNQYGSTYLNLTIAVGDFEPTIAFGGLTTRTLTVGTSIGTITPTLGGGATTSCTAVPTLPAGLSLSSACVMTGTPTTPSAATTYRVIAQNSGGSAELSFNFTVNDIVPAFTYGGPYTFRRGMAATPVAPSSTGGGIISCSASPTLPTGLSLSSTCGISGTPTVLSGATSYTIAATNSGGTTSTTVSITVTDQIPATSFTANPYTFVKGQAVSAVSPVNTGGLITACSPSPALPSGLTLSSSCVISGTPTVVAASNSYVITGSNTAGSSPAVFTMRVNDIPPVINYLGTPYTFSDNVTISAVSPVSSGGTIVSCASSPTLPAGLALSSSCVISGKPTAAVAAANYTITATNSGGTGTKVINIKVNEIAPTISYTGSPFTYNKNVTIPVLTPTAGGGNIVSCAASPVLPAGLSLSNLCVISGTPTAISAVANYTITATNTAGTGSATISITVNDTPPVLSYAGSPYTFYKGVAISTVTPSNSGGAVTSCNSSPPMPSGLSLSSGCVISGTPSATLAATSFSITATNPGGTDSKTISITIDDTAPSIAYAGSPFTFTKGTAISTTTPTNTGGTITGCSASPTLPAGLSLSSACVITGNPSAVSSATGYVVTATNGTGSSPASISITVNDAAPTLSYAANSYVFTKGTAISTLTPTTSGGAITACTATPSLPVGLTLANTTCVVTGTPSAIATANNYVVTASNTGGSASFTLNLTVNDVAPTLSYAGSPFTYTKGTAVSTLTPTTGGGAITSCTASPTLPVGLALANTTCVITGTPLAEAVSAIYTITAANSGGSATANITVAVNDVAPSLSYTGSPFTYTVGTAISTLTPANSGGTVTSCSASPTLPAGLSLSSTCVLSGTPTAVASTTTYTITGTNSGGSSGPTISITVNAVAPALSFTGSPFVFPKNSAITTVTPANSGGAIVSCGVSPSLPTGLSLSNTTCAITGTPTAITAAASYTVTATNSGGSDAKTISLAIADEAPSITYTGGPYSYPMSSAISTLSPVNGGGAITACAVSPSLPAGLSLSTLTCAITGTPTAVTAAALYTVTASNAGGDSATTIILSVNAAAPNLNYIPTTYTFSYTKDTAISTLTPNNTGGAIVSCAISPSAPAGLSFSTSTCELSGTPSAVVAATNYTITATNAGGSSAAVIGITVNDIAPSISYSGSPFTYTKGTAISTLTPTNSGGTITSCSVSPGLPNGLALANTTCVITGNPSAVAATASYTITSTNSGGASSSTISITVNDVAPTLSYTGSPFTYTKGTAISTLTPTTGGGAITSCTASPTLPTGLALDNTTCVISGTPSVVAASTSYTITAANSGGSATPSITIVVKDVVPALSYPGSPYTLTKDSPASITPTSTGGTITSCSPSPALPTGLSLSSTCAITGTPTTITASASYTITATNSGGSTPVNVTLVVNDEAPTISYSPSSQVLMIRTAISTINVSNSGGTITSCSPSPALPAGLSLSSTCAITGTPTALSSSTSYTITATNTGGSSNTSITLRVKDQPYVVFHSLTASTTGPSTWNGTPSGSYNVWKTTQDGQSISDVTSVFASGQSSINATYSADGSQIVFASLLDVTGMTTASYNIWGGTTPDSLTTETTSGRDSSETVFTAGTPGPGISDAPVYSPDGTKIVFTSRMRIGVSSASSYNIWVMNADGTSLASLTANTASGLSAHGPVFSPNGQYVYFSSTMNANAETGTYNGTAESSSNIWKLAVDGMSHPVQLTHDDTSGIDSYGPTVDPTTGKIVFFSTKPISGGAGNASYNIWTMNTDGTGLTALTTITTAGYDSIYPAVSPDGTEVAFASLMKVSGVSTSSYNIWKMSISGASQTALTTNTAASRNSYYPSYSPDSSKIAFTSEQRIGATTANSFNIWVMNEDGTSQTAVTKNTDAGLDSYLSPGSVWYAPP